MTAEEIQEMAEAFSKTTAIINSATSDQDLMIVGLTSLPLIEAHQQMVNRMKSSMESRKTPDLSKLGTIS